MEKLITNLCLKKYFSIIFIAILLTSCKQSMNSHDIINLTSTPSSAIKATEVGPQLSQIPSNTPSPTVKPKPTATPLGGGSGMLTFVSEEYGKFNIYTINVASEEIIQRSFTEEFVENPFWSPDGKSIIFTGKVLTDNTFYEEQVFIVDIESDEINQITSGSQNIAPSWSPGGKELAFLSSRDGSWAIYTMGIDGSNLTKHTDGLGYIDQPFWSPDGEAVILADRENIVADSEIIRIVLGQFGYQNITQNDADDLDPSWSPDGTKIAYVSDREGNYEIYIMGADGSNPTRITFTDEWESLPRWSPDGTKIAFHSNVEGNFDIFMINVDGSDLMRLTEHPAQDVSPIWSPDSNFIAFVSLRDDNRWQDCRDARECNSEIYLVDISSGDLIKLTNNPSADVNPAWQPSLK